MGAAFSKHQKAAKQMVAAKAANDSDANDDNANARKARGCDARTRQKLEDSDRSAKYDARARHADRTVSAPAMQMAETSAVGGVNASDALSDDSDSNDSDNNE